MEKDNVVTILGAAYLAVLVLMLQFGEVIGEGRVIDVVVVGVMQVVR